MKRYVFVLLLVAVGFAGWSTVGAKEVSELLKSKLELATLRLQLGAEHPQVITVKNRIALLEESGKTIEVEEAEEEFLRLCDQRKEQRRSFGPQHPDVIKITKQIEVLAAILTKN